MLKLITEEISETKTETERDCLYQINGLILDLVQSNSSHGWKLRRTKVSQRREREERGKRNERETWAISYTKPKNRGFIGREIASGSLYINWREKIKGKIKYNKNGIESPLKENSLIFLKSLDTIMKIKKKYKRREISISSLSRGKIYYFGFVYFIRKNYRGRAHWTY